MRPSALLTLSLLFSTAFVGRAAVLAANIAGAEKSPPAQQQGSPQSAADDDGDAPACLTGAFADSVRRGFDEVETRRQELAAREQKLSTIESHIAARLAELEAASDSFSRVVNTANEQNMAKVRKLASIYEGMKAQQAGPIVSEMDPGFAAGLLAAMNSESAAQIMANMDAKRAYTISVLMAKQIEAQPSL